MNVVKSPKVIIIGAGASGIATASRLLKNNFDDFIILEAENRIGGRIYSTKFGDSKVDLGAQWCHGEEGNIVYELVEKHDVLKHDKNQFSPFNLIYSNQKYVISPKVQETLTTLFYELCDEGHDTDTVESIGEYFIKHYVEKINTVYSEDNITKQIAEDAKNLFLYVIASLEGSLSVFDVSAKSTYKECKGDQMLHWNGKGFHTVLDVLMNKYPNPEESLPIDDKIFLEKEVQNITWQKKEGKSVLVRCTDGAFYSADYCVVTVSVGVLKERIDSLFTPTLPLFKRSAIEDIGIGAIMKVFLYYPDKWWPDDFDNYGFVWSEEDRDELAKEEKNWIMDVFFLFLLENNPNVLCFFLSHNNIPIIEQKSDEEVLSGMTFLLEKFFSKKYTLTPSTKLLRSKWYHNPHFRGTYSYQSMKLMQTGPSIHEKIAKPLESENQEKPVVFFAGEATSASHYGTAHAAIDSGFKTADKLLELLK